LVHGRSFGYRLSNVKPILKTTLAKVIAVELVVWRKQDWRLNHNPENRRHFISPKHDKDARKESFGVIQHHAGIKSCCHYPSHTFSIGSYSRRR
jgi:hypothetical protein